MKITNKCVTSPKNVLMIPQERSNVPGAITILHNMFAPIPALNYHMAVIAPPNGASLNPKSLK